jgi:regulatory protein
MTKSVNELNADLFADSDATARSCDPKGARRKAMDFLARREYGKDELIGRLRAADFDEDTAAEAVLGLAREGLQDDARFAANFARSKMGRGTGPLRIRQVLVEKGLPERIVDAALADLDADWEEEARRVRLKKFGAEPPADFKEKARQMRFLQYRGFDHDQIRAALGDVP